MGPTSAEIKLILQKLVKLDRLDPLISEIEDIKIYLTDYITFLEIMYQNPWY